MPVGAWAGKTKLFVSKLDAHMGGTEIGCALQAAYKAQGGDVLTQDILLITDGEVWNTEGLIREAKKSGQRIFSVGVGSSVSEAFVEEIARSTGGACELVSPKENMAERIYRHSRRMYGKRSKEVRIVWPTEGNTHIPNQINSVFDGDTVHVFSRGHDKPEGKVNIEIDFNDDASWACSLPLMQMPVCKERAFSDLSRMAANASLETLGDEQAIDIAITYQLMSQWTNFLVIDERPENKRASDLPELRQVPHMLAAGWGGIANLGVEVEEQCCMETDISINTELAAPSFLPTSSLDKTSPKDFIDNFEERLTRLDSVLPLSLDNLDDMGVPEEVIDLLQELIDQGYEESLVVLCFIQTLSNQVSDVSRITKRKVSKEIKNLQVSPALIQQAQATFLGLNNDNWM